MDLKVNGRFSNKEKFGLHVGHVAAMYTYTEASGTGANISKSGSFLTSMLGIEPRTSA